MIFIYILYIY